MRQMHLPVSCVLGLVTLIGCSKGIGQGQVNFNNYVPSSGINAPFYDVDGVTPLGSGYLAQLWYLNVDAWESAGEAIPFRDGVGAGYLDTTGFNSAVALPGIVPGEIATVQIRYWSRPSLSFTEASNSPGAKIGITPNLYVTTGNAGSPPTLPGNLLGLQYYGPGNAAGTAYSLSLVVPIPEPRVTLLALIGTAVFAWRRISRRQRSGPKLLDDNANC